MKNYRNARIVTIFALKINKIPEFYMNFTPKMPEFYIIIAQKYFFSNFVGVRALPASPISYAYATVYV